MKALRRKRVSIVASLRYGLRLTLRHMHSLVPGTVAFYLPELFARYGLTAPGGEVASTVFKVLVGCWLLWHALKLSDRETRSSRFHEPVLPAPGYLGRFLGSTLLFWGVLGLTLWPAWRLASGTWGADPGAAAWLYRPWLWTGPQALTAAWLALASLPAGLWTVYGWFHGYYVADEGQGPWESMRSSFKAVRGAFWPCVLFLGVIAVVNALGLALWVVGVFFAFPVTLMATTYVHLELKRQTPELKKAGPGKPKR
ncbi:MAG TPA: hypothetical protein VK914_09760 [bacterium]|nr:hypothetical protein [bacterium]